MASMACGVHAKGTLWTSLASADRFLPSPGGDKACEGYHLDCEVMHQDILDGGGEGQRESAYATLGLYNRLQLHAVSEDEFYLHSAH